MIEKIGIFKDYSDGSIKSVFQNSDKSIIEMTLLFNKEGMDVVCVPTHHFCNLGCKMCHLTNNKVNKSMLGVKYEDFILALRKSVTKDGKTLITDNKKLFISFMGVGEALLNLTLIEDIFIHEEDIKSLGYESVGYAISTMMPNRNVIKLTELVNRYNKPLKLHFSLHSPIDEYRKELIPSTKVSVLEAFSLLSYYRENVKDNINIINKYVNFHRTSDPVEIHYTLINGVNDSKNELMELIRLLNIYKIPIKFIRFNEINEMVRSINEEKWVKEIKKSVEGLRVKTYSPPGREIGSSCGEFTKHYYHMDIESEEEREEFEKWVSIHQIDGFSRKLVR